MQKINYQKQMDALLKALPAGTPPTLLLHSCCGPCSSYVLSYLTEYFNIELLYYNPNIHPAKEYQKRLAEQQRLIDEMPFKNRVELLPCRYDPKEFFDAVKGLEDEREGGARCETCFRLRLQEAQRVAKERCAAFFCTTLTVSPHKNAALINEIGLALQKEGITYLCSDFKKKEGYKQSIALSKQYDLYRQSYCGCVFSLRESEGQL